MLSICIANHCRTALETREGVLRLLPRMLESAEASARAAGVDYEIIVAETEATLPPLAEWHRGARLVPLPVPFSLGRGRNVAVAEAIGGVLAVLDADMLIPKRFFADTLPRLTGATACFPLYRRYCDASHTATSTGAGWGNVVATRKAFQRVQQHFGQWWPEPVTWGGEDTVFANRVRAAGCQILRPENTGLLHQWHPKDGEWYGQAEKG